MSGSIPARHDRRRTRPASLGVRGGARHRLRHGVGEETRKVEETLHLRLGRRAIFRDPWPQEMGIPKKTRICLAAGEEELLPAGAGRVSVTLLVSVDPSR